MAAVKRTYTLPEETVQEFEAVVEVGKRSSVIARIMKDWVEMQKRAKLREAIIEGCREMYDVQLEIEREWQPLDDEVWRKYCDGP